MKHHHLMTTQVLYLVFISGVVRQSAAWGENKKCRPCLYFLRLLEYDSGSFDWLFCLPKIWIWFKWNKKLWTAIFLESLTVTILFTESSSNPRTLWETLNSILHCYPSNSSPAWHTWQTITCQFIPPIFQWQNWTHLFQISLFWFPDPHLFPIIPPY